MHYVTSQQDGCPWPKLSSPVRTLPLNAGETHAPALRRADIWDGQTRPQRGISRTSSSLSNLYGNSIRKKWSVKMQPGEAWEERKGEGSVGQRGGRAEEDKGCLGESG